MIVRPFAEKLAVADYIRTNAERYKSLGATEREVTDDINEHVELSYPFSTSETNHIKAKLKLSWLSRRFINNDEKYLMLERFVKEIARRLLELENMVKQLKEQTASVA